MENSKTIFISYSHEDISFVNGLSKGLQEHGIKVLEDTTIIRTGDSIPKEIAEAIVSADFVVCVLSDNFINSAWCMKELDIAVAEETNRGKDAKFILPILKEKAKIPKQIINKHVTDFTNLKNFDGNLSELLKSIDVPAEKNGELQTTIPTTPYYVIYIDSDAGSTETLDETIVEHYSDVLMALNEVDGKLANHFNNSIVVSFGNNNSPDNIINFLAKLLGKNNYRVGIHFFESQKIDPSSLNEKLREKLKDKIDLENRIQKILPEEYFCNKTEYAKKEQKQKIASDGGNGQEEQDKNKFANRNIKFFHSNEIFGPEVSYAAEIAYSTEHINFILSEEVVFQILNINTNKKRRKIIQKIDDFYDDPNKNFLISYPIPIGLKNNEVKCSFFIYSKNKDDKTPIIEKFMPSFVSEKQKLKYLYIFYSTPNPDNPNTLLGILGELIKDYFLNNNFKKDAFKKADISYLSRYFLDSIYLVYGYLSINFMGNESLELKDVIKNNKDYNNYDKTKVPIVIALASFPNNDLDHYYRTEINSDSKNQVYIRSETVFDERLLDSLQNNEALINGKNEISIETIKSIFTKKAIYEYEEGDEKEPISYKEGLTREIAYNKEYVLILFSLVPTKLYREQKIENIFEQFFNKNGYHFSGTDQKFYLISKKYLEILGFGILRGTWDGYIICRITRCKNYKEVIEKIIREKEKQKGRYSFIKNNITKCELFFMQPLVWDEWTKALMKERIKLNSHSELLNNNQNQKV